MDRRTQAPLRDYVDLVAWCAETGHMSTYAAACRLEAAGVPLDAALRKLARRSA